MTVQGGIVEFVKPGVTLTVSAGGTIVGGQLVKLSANRTVVITAAVNDLALGIALYNAVSGDANLTVATDGVWPITAKGAVTYGDLLVADAAGAASTLAVGAGDTAPHIITGLTAVSAVIAKALESIADTATGRGKLKG